MTGRGCQQDVARESGFFSPKTGKAKGDAAGLTKQDAFLVKSIDQQQATLVQVRLESRELGQRFAFGVYERAFIPWHLPAPAHFTTSE